MSDYISNGEIRRDYDLSKPEDRRDFFIFVRDWWLEVKSMKEIDYSEDPPLEAERKYLVEWAERLKKDILADPTVRGVLDEYKFKLEGIAQVGKTVFKLVEGLGEWVDRALDFSSQEIESKKNNKVSKLRTVKKISGLAAKGFVAYTVGEKLLTVGSIFLALYLLEQVISKR